MKRVKSITNYNDYKCSDSQFPMNISLLYYSLKLGKEKELQFKCGFLCTVYP